MVIAIARSTEEQLITATAQMDPATAALDRFGHSEYTYREISNFCGLSASTLCHRKNGRMSIQQRATNQQYLSPQEEKALLTYVLRMAKNGYPLPVKFLRDLALVIVRQRGSIFQIPTTDRGDLRPPGKNWPQAFYKRYPELKAIRMQAMDWQRHDHHIHEKVVE
jgi:Tc5 transposase DNA-binding domain